MYKSGNNYLDDHVGISETFDTLSTVVQNSNSVTSLLCFGVLDFAFGNVLRQKFIHELQGVRNLFFGPWHTFRDAFCVDRNCCSPVQQEHRDLGPQGGYVCNAESYMSLSIPARLRHVFYGPICPAPSTPTVRTPWAIGAAILNDGVVREIVSGRERGDNRGGGGGSS